LFVAASRDPSGFARARRFLVTRRCRINRAERLPGLP
jgi:hypothetical protein